MGCDIHLYKEKKVDGKWITADVWETLEGDPDDPDEQDITVVPYKDRFTERNYDLFGFLSKGVRTEFPFSFLERGLPADVSPEVKQNSNIWSHDAHSHSYLYLHELEDAVNWLKSKKITISGMKDAQQVDELLKSLKSDSPNYDLIYPYCSWTNQENYVKFSIEVPADYVLSGVKRIISLFEGIDGDNHRIVFWFDN